MTINGMTINGIEVDFDLDNRKDNARFVKAYQEVAKKVEKGFVNDNDMEAFLNTCLKPEQAKELLKDGRISTLARVFTEFFSQAVEQFGSVSRVYSDVAESLVTMKQNADRITEEYDEVQLRLDSITPKDGGEQ